MKTGPAILTGRVLNGAPRSNSESAFCVFKYAEGIGMLKRFIADENGLEVIEYAIMTGLILAGAILAIAQCAICFGRRCRASDTKQSVSS